VALFLDSAHVEDAQRAAELGFVWGATTNPKLLSQVDRQPADVIADFCDLLPGTVFYQLTAPTVEERREEALRMLEINPAQVGLKIPCTTENLSLLAHLTDQGITCAVTAIFSTHQAYLACEAGAHYVLPYVNRSTRLQGSGTYLVQRMVQVIEAVGSDTDLLAGSIKTPAEAVETILAGAHHLTVPLDLILALGDHTLSQQAIEEFDQAMKN
jgi:transaldolase